MPRDESSGAMRELGLLLAKRIEERKSGPLVQGERSGFNPALFDLLFLERQELTRLLQGISLDDEPGREVDPARRLELCELLAGLAVSYARDGDVSIVATLVRALGQMGFSGPWLDDAVDFLEAQSCPAGAFGLLAIEADQLKLKSEGILDGSGLLRTTVEVLWAFAAVFGSIQKQRPGETVQGCFTALQKGEDERTDVFGNAGVGLPEGPPCDRTSAWHPDERTASI